MTTCMHAKVHEEFFCFTLLAGAPSLGKFPYSINVLPTKRCLFLITLVWSPYVYSPWYGHKRLVSLYLVSMHNAYMQSCNSSLISGPCPNWRSTLRSKYFQHRMKRVSFYVSKRRPLFIPWWKYLVRIVLR